MFFDKPSFKQYASSASTREIDQLQRQVNELRTIAVRIETRLCLLLEHLGADTKIESRNKK